MPSGIIRRRRSSTTSARRNWGNYPMIDVFAAAKWKRMRILIKMQHLNENMFGDRNYFTVLHYPQNPRMFKLGVSWSFYD
ncbi:MAG: putative porin [Alistipes sp.]